MSFSQNQQHPPPILQQHQEHQEQQELQQEQPTTPTELPPPPENILVAPIAFPKTFITPCFIEQPSILTDWRYEYRRVAQQVDSNLWLGPLCIVRNEDFLRQRNISVLIFISDMRMVPAVVRHRYEPSGEFTCLTYDPGNRISNPMNIVSQLETICANIRDAEAIGTSTLVYCESGNEASALVVVAYMIYKHGMNFVRAIQHVQSKRFSIALDDAAKYNLKTFEDICSAKRLLANQPRTSPLSSKRNIRMRDDDEDDLEEEYTLTRAKIRDIRDANDE
ncbi:uncharacterized protein SAPINGB_P006100 [Magnusiomyces paraingens]|uniref:Tyrosine specific protein phosphatases domain-containing protein n=1 Tax=Magnusiomyces paraingens TaxID=2606893 RepID=A0A5E8CAE5_9ASCO|nr:uncharacterized protein SAPINGB_P006100 [Saprochaete ingens]VVT58226.1 unnamed protein product [Saprochaete ingens]